jgi:hypothetical protein
MRGAVLLVVLGAIVAALGHQFLASSPSTASSSSSSSPRAASPIDVRAGSKDAAVASTLGIGAGVNAITTLGEKA